MNGTRIETVGKVFVVICGMRRCLICDEMFTPAQAATHATTPCYPEKKSVLLWRSHSWSVSGFIECPAVFL
jgi:hypothetical protein